MFTKNDIIARLESGTPVEAIADEMAQALNEAQVEYAKSQEEARIKDEEARKLHNGKREAMEVILDGFSDYLYVAGEEDLMDELAECNIDELIEGFDAMLELAKGLKSIKPVVEGISKGEETAASPVAGTWGELMDFLFD
jgi:hypothetical protein